MPLHRFTYTINMYRTSVDVRHFEICNVYHTFIQVDQVDFDKLIDYDNKCFVSQNFAPRREFLRLWTQVPGGATYVAQDDDGHVIGYGCRRPAIPPSEHLVGPLYAENVQVAEAILSKLCSDVSGDDVTLQIW
jgi:Acetyltransferase (GNAT) domain